MRPSYAQAPSRLSILIVQVAGDGNRMTGKTPKKKERPGVDRMGRTPLHHAALDGTVAVAKRLLSKGADPSARDDNHWTPLHFAVQAECLALVKLLLHAGAEVDARDSDGNTPLLKATFQYTDDKAIIALLCAHGADPKCTGCRRSVLPSPAGTTR
jgi:ankyrin repeat protein